MASLLDQMNGELSPNEPKTTTSTTPSPTFAPAKGQTRVDQHNNPLAVIYASNFNKVLDDANIPYSKGKAFPTNEGGDQYHTLQFNTPEDGMEASRQILSKTNAFEKWYANHTGKEATAKYGVRNATDFTNLDKGKQDEVIKSIAASEGSHVFPKMSTAPSLSDIMAKELQPDNVQPPITQPQGGIDPVQDAASAMSKFGKDAHPSELRPDLKNIAEARMAARNQDSGGNIAEGLGTAAQNWADTVSLGSMTRGTAIMDSIAGGDGGAVEKDLSPHQNNLIEQEIKKARGAEHPYMAAGGRIAGVLTPQGGVNAIGKGGEALGNGINAALGLDKALPLLSKALPLAAQGAGIGGSYDVGTNPDFNADSVKHAAEMGAVTGVAAPVVVAGAKAALGGPAKAITDVVMGKLGIGKYMQKYMSPSLTSEGLKTQNQEVMGSIENKLQDTLSKYSDSQIPLKDVGLKVDDIFKMAVNKEQSVQHEFSDKLMEIASKAESNGGFLSPVDANVVKRAAYDWASFNDFGQAGSRDISKGFSQVGGKLRAAIEDATESDVVKGLNKDLSTGIKLKNVLLRQANKPSSYRTYAELAAAIKSGGTAIPGIIAERALTSTPGLTTMNAGARVAGKGLDAISPYISKIMSALVPQNTK